MTDISTDGPVAVRSSDAQQPKPGIGAQFAAMFALFGDALRMAYADPYASRRPEVAPEDQPGGRDPRWLGARNSGYDDDDGRWTEDRGG